MSAFFQVGLWSFLTNLFSLAPGQGVLIMIISIAFGLLHYKMSMGFKDIRAEMREGFLKVNHHLENRDREIRRIKKKLRRQP
jgi:hypothetical protein